MKVMRAVVLLMTLSVALAACGPSPAEDAAETPDPTPTVAAPDADGATAGGTEGHEMIPTPTTAVAPTPTTAAAPTEAVATEAPDGGTGGGDTGSGAAGEWTVLKDPATPCQYSIPPGWEPFTPGDTRAVDSVTGSTSQLTATSGSGLKNYVENVAKHMVKVARVVEDSETRWWVETQVEGVEGDEGVHYYVAVAEGSYVCTLAISTPMGMERAAAEEIRPTFDEMVRSLKVTEQEGGAGGGTAADPSIPEGWTVVYDTNRQCQYAAPPDYTFMGAIAMPPDGAGAVTHFTQTGVRFEDIKDTLEGLNPAETIIERTDERVWYEPVDNVEGLQYFVLTPSKSGADTCVVSLSYTGDPAAIKATWDQIVQTVGPAR